MADTSGVNLSPPPGWKQPHLKEQERMALAEERASSWYFTLGKAKEVAADLQQLDIERRQRLVDQNQLMTEVRQGGIVDLFA